MPSPITATPRPPDPAWYATAMESLVRVVQELSQAHTVDEVTAIVRRAARQLTGADGATFVLRDGDLCYYADEDAIAPLWKGKRFPMSACVSGWVMQNRRSTTIEDILADPRVPADAYRPTFVKSMAMVPIRRNEPIGAIGTYWATCRQPAAEEVALLQALADATSVALQNADLYGKLYEQVRTLQRQKDHIRQQRDSIDIFARALAHDLKEPVRTLKSYSRLAFDCSEQPEDQSEYLRFIQAAADRMGILVDSVLRYMELEGDSQAAAVLCDAGQAAETVRQNLAQLISERSAHLEISSLPTVQAQPGHLVQLLQNLVSNAIRHNDRGVVVRVSACQTDQGWVFSVADNGRGVPLEQAAMIFRPFKRLIRNDDCAGLGLAICEKIVRRYGGTIWCRPNTGGGACFDFALPHGGPTENQVPRTATGMEAEPTHEDEPLACLLLVDDMPADLRLSQVMLARKAKLKCRVLTAEDGEQALNVLSREKVDLVLLDINMPNIDGFEALERIQRDKIMKHVAVIMCTGSDYEKDKERARSLGAIGYVLKPANFDDIIPFIMSVPTLRLRPQRDGYQLLRVPDAAA